jgi:endonuclease YncB( thermonuclease family)
MRLVGPRETCVVLALIGALAAVAGCEADRPPSKPRSAPQQNTIRSPFPPPKILTGTVTDVVDGDTLTVRDQKKRKHRVRLLGIDAPEGRQAFGQASTNSLVKLTFARSVTVEYGKRDKYDRIVGKVLVDGRDAGLTQIQSGLAWHYREYAGDQSPVDRALYSSTEADARTAGAGLWQSVRPVPPWVYRDRNRD